MDVTFDFLIFMFLLLQLYVFLPPAIVFSGVLVVFQIQRFVRKKRSKNKPSDENCEHKTELQKTNVQTVQIEKPAITAQSKFKLVPPSNNAKLNKDNKRVKSLVPFKSQKVDLHKLKQQSKAMTNRISIVSRAICMVICAALLLLVFYVAVHSVNNVIDLNIGKKRVVWTIVFTVADGIATLAFFVFWRRAYKSHALYGFFILLYFELWLFYLWFGWSEYIVKNINVSDIEFKGSFFIGALCAILAVVFIIILLFCEPVSNLKKEKTPRKQINAEVKKD